MLLTTQGCARLRTGPIIMQIPRDYQKKKFIVWKGAICATLREKTPFLAFPEAKKGVVNYARLRKAAHWPNNNANPSAISEKKVYQKKKFIVWKGAICATLTLREKTPFLAFPEAKKGVVNYARLRKAAHWPNNNANSSGYQKKKFIVWKGAICATLGVVNYARLRKAATPIIMQIPRGYQKKKFIV